MPMQYIGARYVPKYATPFEWDINATYEPLTIVGYQGNSYTSKTTVPAGTQISDEKYWALTASQSGAVDDLTRRIKNAETEITTLTDITDSLGDDVAQNTSDIKTLKNSVENLNLTGKKIPGMRNVILIGDSYASTTTTWFTHLISLLGVDHANVKTGAAAGMGYLDREGTSFLTILSDIVAAADAEWIQNVTHIIVGTAGNGDGTEAQFASAIKAFADYWKTEMPNANCYNMCIGRYTNGKSLSKKSNNYAYIEKGCRENGMIVSYGTKAALYNKSWVQSDEHHPNANGCKQIAAAMYSALLSGDVSLSAPLVTFNSTTMPGLTRPGDFYEMVVDGNYIFGKKGDPAKYALSTPHEERAVTFEIGEWTSAYATGSSEYYNIVLDSEGFGTENDSIQGSIIIYENKMYFRAYANITGLKSVIFRPFMVTIPINNV